MKNDKDEHHDITTCNQLPALAHLLNSDYYIYLIITLLHIIVCVDYYKVRHNFTH